MDTWGEIPYEDHLCSGDYFDLNEWGRREDEEWAFGDWRPESVRWEVHDERPGAEAN